MSCHVTCCAGHVIWCDVTACCVMSRDALRCHMTRAHVKSCHLLRPAMGWNVINLKRHYSLNNYSVLQSTTPVLLCTTSTTPVLLCTTKYNSSTTLYYKVLLQYYSVLQSTTPVLLCTGYYFETSFTMRVATRVTLQLLQILRLPRKMNVMIDRAHI